MSNTGNKYLTSPGSLSIYIPFSLAQHFCVSFNFKCQAQPKWDLWRREFINIIYYKCLVFLQNWPYLPRFTVLFFSHCAFFCLPIQTVKECWWERSCGHDRSTFKPWRPLGKANSRVFCWSPPSAWWPSLLRNPIFFSCLSEMCLGRRGGWKEVNSLNRVRTTNSVSEWVRINYNQRDRSLMLQKNIASYLHLLSGDFIK